MQTKLMLTILWVGTCGFGIAPVAAREPLALTLVIDASGSCDRYLPEFATLSGQAIGSGLTPRDYLEVISGHAGKPKIRVAQTIRSASTEETRGITAVLRNIRGDFLADAYVSTALALALKRLEDTCSQRQFKRAAVIVFSDGALRDDDAQKVVELADRFQKHGWGLYFTGTSSTNRKLLVAASQKRLRWSLIGEANPVLWLTQLPEASDQGQPARAKTDQGRPAVTAAEPPQTSPAPADRHPVASTTKKDDTGASDYKVSTSFNLEVSSPSAREQPPGERAPAPEVTSEKAAEPTAVAAPQPPAETAKDQPRFWQSLWQRLGCSPGKALLWALPLLLGLAAGIALLLWRGVREARQWQARTSSKLRTGKTEDTGILVMRVNDQNYRLGRPDQVKAIHVGSAEDNSIRIPDKSIEGRHLCLYRKSGSLMLRNLSHAPLVVNSNLIKPGHKVSLVVPSVIKINDRIKLNLELVRPQTSVKTTDNRRAQNEPEER